MNINTVEEFLTAIKEQRDILHAIYAECVPDEWFALARDALDESVAWARKGIEHGPIDFAGTDYTGRPINPEVPPAEQS